jgi:MATE family multidrug resistance protein
MTAAEPAIDAPRFERRILRHWSGLFRLAWPVMLSRTGILILSLTDFLMVGRHSTVALAHLSLGYSLSISIMVTGVGAMVGVVAVTARDIGAGRRDLAGENFRRGLAWALPVGAAVAVLAWFGETWLLLIGHDPALAAGGGLVARWFAPGAFLQMLFVACTFWLEGTKRMLPGLVVMALANVVNLALNFVLIEGRFGLPALGAEGAVIASTVARFFLAAAILVWVLRLPEIRRVPWGGLFGPGGWRAGREMRTIGLAAGAAFFFETMSFAAMNQVAGLISPEALGAYSIAFQVQALLFMVALGLSVATAVEVGHARGAGDAATAAFAGWSGLAATLGVMVLICVPLMLFRDTVAGWFSTDPVLIARTAPLFMIVAVALVFDAGQVVAGQSVRALGDSWVTTLCFFTGFWLVMLPLGIWLGLATPWAESGLFAGITLGCAVVLVLLALRFRVLVARLRPAR